jgi:protein TonB
MATIRKLTGDRRRRPPIGAVQGPWSAQAARDRLSSLLFLAALVHGILILGVTFTADAPSRAPAATSLEVVLVTGNYEKLPAPLNPSLLSQHNLIGRGNVALHERLRTSLPQSEELALPGPDQPGLFTEPQKTGTPGPAQSRITAAATEQPQVRRGETGAPSAPVRRAFLSESRDPVEIIAEPDVRSAIPDANPRELLVSANTRESRIAGYLNNWKAKVERIGTLNFPRSAELSRIGAHPVLEVAITADGELKEVVVRNSSGHHRLDQAAMDILRIAAPFEPFPQSLRENYDVLRFAYEWHFGRGDGRGRVTTVGGT